MNVVMFCEHYRTLRTVYLLQVPGLSVDPLNADPTAETIQPELKKLRTV